MKRKDLRNRALGLIARRHMQPLWRELYRLALGGLGFMNGDPRFNGEHRFLAELAGRWAREGRRSPVVIDAGANEGDFTAAVLAAVPGAQVYAFEPNPPTWRRLAARFRDEPRVRAVQAALAGIDGMLPLYDIGGGGSGHASLEPETFRLIHPGPAEATPVPARTLDGFLAANMIPRIDLLKLDVEGAEQAVLDGGTWSLSQGRVAAIQMEFNAHNLLSGLSLLTLTRRLPDYDIHRIVADGLVPLVTDARPYHPREEIFRYSNLALLRRGGGWP